MLLALLIAWVCRLPLVERFIARACMLADAIADALVDPETGRLRDLPGDQRLALARALRLAHRNLDFALWLRARQIAGLPHLHPVYLFLDHARRAPEPETLLRRICEFRLRVRKFAFSAKKLARTIDPLRPPAAPAATSPCFAGGGLQRGQSSTAQRGRCLAAPSRPDGGGGPRAPP